MTSPKNVWRDFEKEGCATRRCRFHSGPSATTRPFPRRGRSALRYKGSLHVVGMVILQNVLHAVGRGDQEQAVIETDDVAMSRLHRLQKR